MKQHNLLSLSEISTVGASFAADLRAYTAAGFEGIGIWEMKLGDDEADLKAFRASGLRATNCVPLVPSILPNAVIEGPADVEERIASICVSVRRLARYEPDCVLCLTGAAELASVDSTQARALVVEGLRRIAAAAGEAGVRLGLEPIHASQQAELTIVTTVPGAVELLDEAGLPEVGILVDLWHVWDTPDVERHLRENVDRITGVHVSDWFPEERSGRALPGQGASRTKELMVVLAEAGWTGAWDVEIFADPGDAESFWSLPVEVAARLAYEALTGVVPYARR